MVSATSAPDNLPVSSNFQTGLISSVHSGVSTQLEKISRFTGLSNSVVTYPGQTATILMLSSTSAGFMHLTNPITACLDALYTGLGYNGNKPAIDATMHMTIGLLRGILAFIPIRVSLMGCDALTSINV